MEREERELARGLRRRDADLLERLIERYQHRLFRYLLFLTGSRESAEDLFQETWMRVLERGHQYDGRSKFETWLFAIARHLAIDLQRRKQPASLDELLEATEGQPARELAAPWEVTALDQVAGREEGERIQSALARLPASYREVLVLRFHEDLALQEIAVVVSAPLSTIKSRLYRGLEELRRCLQEGKA